MIERELPSDSVLCYFRCSSAALDYSSRGSGWLFVYFHTSPRLVSLYFPPLLILYFLLPLSIFRLFIRCRGGVYLCFFGKYTRARWWPLRIAGESTGFYSSASMIVIALIPTRGAAVKYFDFISKHLFCT